MKTKVNTQKCKKALNEFSCCLKFENKASMAYDSINDLSYLNGLEMQYIDSCWYNFVISRFLVINIDLIAWLETLLRYIGGWLMPKISENETQLTFWSLEDLTQQITKLRPLIRKNPVILERLEHIKRLIQTQIEKDASLSIGSGFESHPSHTSLKWCLRLSLGLATTFFYIIVV